MGLADHRSIKEQTIEKILCPKQEPKLKKINTQLTQKVHSTLHSQGVKNIKTQSHLHIKYSGSDSTIEVPLASIPIMRQQFKDFHKQQFGFTSPNKVLIVEKIHVESFGGGGSVRIDADLTNVKHRIIRSKIFLKGRWQSAEIVHRNQLNNSIKELAGPAIILEDHGTNYLEKGWIAYSDQKNNLIFERKEALNRTCLLYTSPSPRDRG